jgi:DNA-binding LytR/AlgR family response regulator
MALRGALAGRKVLVVEDNFLIAEHVRSVLLREGCEVLGPAARVAQALTLVRTAEALDGGLLDINLGEELCFPVAAALAERSVPWVFLTGYDGPAIVPAQFAERPLLPKPLDERRLIEVIKATIENA